MSKQLILLVVALLLSLSFALAKHRDAFDEMAELADWPFAEKKVCPDICPPTNCKHGLNTDINGCPLPTCARLEGNDKWIRNGESLLKNVKQVCFYQEVCRMHCPYGFKSYKGCPICECYQPKQVPKPVTPVQTKPVKLVCTNSCKCGFKPGHGFSSGLCQCNPDPIPYDIKCSQLKCSGYCPYGREYTTQNKCYNCSCQHNVVKAEWRNEINRRVAQEQAARNYQEQLAQQQAQQQEQPSEEPVEEPVEEPAQ